jgi:predicted transcriptional regulator
MISPRQVKAARALLGWSQQELADRAVVSKGTIASLELGKADTRMSTLTAIQKALNRGGIEFISEDDVRGEGLRFSAPSAERGKP